MGVATGANGNLLEALNSYRLVQGFTQRRHKGLDGAGSFAVNGKRVLRHGYPCHTALILFTTGEQVVVHQSIRFAIDDIGIEQTLVDFIGFHFSIKGLGQLLHMTTEFHQQFSGQR